MLEMNRPTNRVIALLLLAFGLVSAAPFSPSSRVLADGPVSESGVKWEYLENDDGIDVWTQQVPGKELPGFRGQVIIEASLQHILDEMMDSKHHTDWMYRVKESVVLKELSKKWIADRHQQQTISGHQQQQVTDMRYDRC